MISSIEVSNDQSPCIFNRLVKRLEKKEEIERRTYVLREEIATLERIKNHSSQRIFQLEGRGRSSYALVQLIIRVCFSFWNRRPLDVQKSFHHLFEQGLNQKKIELSNKISRLTKLTGNLPAYLERFNNEAEPIRQDEIMGINEQNISAIFNLENRLRAIISDPEPSHELYQRVYEQTIRPLASQATRFLKLRPFSYTAQAAAGKGKACHAYFKALPLLFESNKWLRHNAGKHQKVILSPQTGTVFKNSSKRAKEEEKLIDQLFAFYAKQGIVSGFFISHSQHRNGFFALNDQEKKRAVPLSRSPNKLTENIRKKLSSQFDETLVDSYVNPMTKDEKKNTSDLKEYLVYVAEPTQYEFKQSSLKKLKLNYLAGKTSPNTMIGISRQRELLTFYLREIKEDQLRLYRYLNGLDLDSSLSFTYLPDLSNPENKKAYEECESFIWEYQDLTEKWHRTSFYDLHHLSLSGYVFKDLLSIDPLSRKELPSQESISRALNVPWKLIPSEILRLKSNGSITGLKSYRVTPFINCLVNLDDLHGFSVAVSSIFANLTPIAEFKAVLTGIFQFLDLHGSNIGIVPLLQSRHQPFVDKTFYLPSSKVKVDFKGLLLNYLNGKISEEEKIDILGDGGHKICTKTVATWPLMKSIRKIKWDLVFFDADLSLGENNTLQFQHRQEQKQHLIPLRSAFLGLDWKDKSLQTSTLKLLLASEECDQRLKNWIQQADAPIRRRLSFAVQKKIDCYLETILKDFSLSLYRQEDEEATISDLKKIFVEEIIDESKHAKLWQYLESEVSLPSAEPALEAKKRWIAGQLFPRLTKRQCEALTERLEQMRKYLRDYLALCTLKAEGKEMLEILKIYISQTNTPLSSWQIESYLVSINKAMNSSDILNISFSLYQQLCAEWQPTYFNLMKVMYPLLADTLILYEKTIKKFKEFKEENLQHLLDYSSKRLSGEAIGAFHAPLEEAIELAKTNFPSDDKYHQLALKLETQIKQCHAPSYFGYWE